MTKAADKIIVALDVPTKVAALDLVDLNLIVERNRRDHRLDFVKAVLASTQNLQRKIDLRRREDLHSLQFVRQNRKRTG